MKRHIHIIGVGISGLILLGIGIYLLLPTHSEVSIVIEKASTVKGSIRKEAVGEITVDIVGVVTHPGVYRHSFAARLKDAVVAAE